MDAFHPDDWIPRGAACSRPDLALLLRASVDLPLDGGPQLAAHARTCRACGPRWRLLRRAQAWLSSPAAAVALRAPGSGDPLDHGGDPATGEACPDAEDLFDLGSGLEAGARLADVRAHVARCASCSAFVDTLGTPFLPLAPLATPRAAAPARELSDRPERARHRARRPEAAEPPEHAGAPAPSSGEGTPTPAGADRAPAAELPQRSHPLRLVADEPFAASEAPPAEIAPDARPSATPRPGSSAGRYALAAAVLIAVVGIGARLVGGAGGSETALRGLPSVETLRGSAASPLRLPREKLLRGADGLLHPFAFEIEPQADAGGYRVRLLRRAAEESSAFGAGSELLRMAFDTPRCSAGLDLAAGRYTWEAWARVGGLEVALGRRDFEVVEDDALARELAGLAQASEDGRRDASNRLWERGFRADALSVARELPPSPDRDAFLERALAR